MYYLSFSIFFLGGGGRFLLALLFSMGNRIGWHCGLLCLQYSFWEVAVFCGLLDVHVSTVWCERGVRSGWPKAENILVGVQQKVRIHLEYLSVSVPSSKLWPLPPLPLASGSPPGTKGGDTLACRWGGSQFGWLEKNPSTLFTLWRTICTIASRS
jgi:hypothetical protein